MLTFTDAFAQLWIPYQWGTLNKSFFRKTVQPLFLFLVISSWNFLCILIQHIWYVSCASNKLDKHAWISRLRLEVTALLIFFHLLDQGISSFFALRYFFTQLKALEMHK